MSTNPSQQTAIAKLKLPHPYLTTYYVFESEKVLDGNTLYQLRKDESPSSLEIQLCRNSLYFTDVQETLLDAEPPASDNSAWARCQRAPGCSVTWNGLSETPWLGQMWLVIYAIFTMKDDLEAFRLKLVGGNHVAIQEALTGSMLAINCPSPLSIGDNSHAATRSDEVLVLRSAFWQGCGSPFGARPAWTPTSNANDTQIVPHLSYTVTTNDRVHRRHPLRAPKPKPGTVVYSRYIPFLDEHFSLIALDYRNEEHLQLFHRWQNDPRVAQGWNETGTWEEHREYLRRQEEDPHTFTVLGCFDETPFSYFEIFWAKEDPIGAHFDAQNFDRGRHTLVGEDKFRGAYRVMAWWPSIMHYIFLDDHRTETVIGEPRWSRSSDGKVLKYDYTFGLNQEHLIDLPHKRASFVRCGRERFFQLCPFHQRTVQIAGTSLAPLARL